jgi:hypothetical protein
MCLICKSVKLKRNSKYCLPCVREVDRRCAKAIKDLSKGMRENIIESMKLDSKTFTNIGFLEPWKV